MPPRPRRRNNYHRNAVNRKTATKDEMVPLELKHRKKCMFCGHKDIDETLYGPMYKLNDVVVHYFCILLSSLAVQHGADEEGIWGFLLKDIKKELKRGSEINCFYCKETGATIACCNKQCRKIFHLPCGLKNGSMHQFFQTFKSFCQQHRITQTVDLKALNDKSPTQCAICKEDITPAPLQDTLWAPCCKRNSWFHRRCVQDMALSAGYFFKCPLCNNVETFKFRMLTHGIYIPSRDASWETVPDAFAELLDRPSSCTATVCVCPHPEGRDAKEDIGAWNIVLCSTCGSCGIHMLCGGLKFEDPWNCESCVSILAAGANTKKRKVDCLNDEEPVASTSGLVNGQPVASTSGLVNGEPVPSTSRMTNGEPVASTSGSVHRPFRELCCGVKKLQLCGLTNGHAEASTSRLSNGHAEVSTSKLSNVRAVASTSGLSNGHPVASTSRLSNGHAVASTSRLSNGHAVASASRLSNGYAVAPTSRLSNGHAVASTSKCFSNQAETTTTKLINRRATSSVTRVEYTKQPNKSAPESTDSSSNTLNSTSTPTGYNLRRRSKKLETKETPSMKISICMSDNGMCGQSQSNSSNHQQFIESIVISDSSDDDDDDDVQIISFLGSHTDPAIGNGNVLPLWPVIQNYCTVPPDLSKVTIDSQGRFVVESIDLTLEDD